MKHFKKNDNYCTPLSAWKNVEFLFDKELSYWDPFYCSGSSGTDLKSLGLDIHHSDVDFFEVCDEMIYDVIITNPPFSIKKQVLQKLFEIGKPFIMIMPIAVLSSKFYKKFVKETTVIIPPKRIQFMRPDGSDCGTKCPFDCYYYVWKFDLGTELIAL